MDILKLVINRKLMVYHNSRELIRDLPIKVLWFNSCSDIKQYHFYHDLNYCILSQEQHLLIYFKLQTIGAIKALFLGRLNFYIISGQYLHTRFGSHIPFKNWI